MADAAERCPCCRRPFNQILDYPLVRIVLFERLPLPEAVDDLSEVAAQKSLEWHRKNPAGDSWTRRGINMTPEIERACRKDQVQQYLDRLTEVVGQELDPVELLPSFPVDRTFKRCYPISDTQIFLSLTEGEPTADGSRTAEVQALCRGPNLGSAGGPTLMHLGAIARLTYQGRLAASTVGK
jgi:hypothetical protein